MFLICTASPTAPAVFILEFYAHLLHLSHDRRWFLSPALLHLCSTLPAAPTRDDHARQYSPVRFCALLEERERITESISLNYQYRNQLESLTQHETSSTVCLCQYSDGSSICYSTVTLNCDLLTPKVNAIISVPQNTISLAKMCQIFCNISCEQCFRTHTRTHARTDEQDKTIIIHSFIHSFIHLYQTNGPQYTQYNTIQVR